MNKNCYEDGAVQMKVPKASLYGIMVLGLLFPIAFYFFASAFLQHYINDIDTNYLLYGILFLLLVPVVMGLYAYDILLVGKKTGKYFGLALLFLIYKPAYPLYRQTLLEERPWSGLVYLFVSGFLSALVNVRLVFWVLVK